MEGERPGVLSLVLVPALLTLVVTILRLVGELNGWSPLLVGTKEGGVGGGLIAIIWLVFPFGFWFGLELQRNGAGPRNPKRALWLSLLAPVVLIGGMVGLGAAGLITFPNEADPVQAQGGAYIGGLCAATVLVSFAAWSRAAWTLLVYAACARIPVLVITWIALQQAGWDTHYTKIAAGFVPPPADERLSFLMVPQVTFWPAITVALGTILASLAALVVARRKPT